VAPDRHRRHPRRQRHSVRLELAHHLLTWPNHLSPAPLSSGRGVPKPRGRPLSPGPAARGLFSPQVFPAARTSPAAHGPFRPAPVTFGEFFVDKRCHPRLPAKATGGRGGRPGARDAPISPRPGPASITPLPDPRRSHAP